MSMELAIVGGAIGVAYLYNRAQEAKQRRAAAEQQERIEKAKKELPPPEPLGPVIYDETKEPGAGKEARPGEGVRQSSGQVVFAGSPVHLAGAPPHLTFEHQATPHLPPLFLKTHPGASGIAARQQLDSAIPALRAAGLTEMQVTETSSMVLQEATRPKEELYRKVYEQVHLDTPLDRAQMRALTDPLQVTASALQVDQRRVWGLW